MKRSLATVLAAKWRRYVAKSGTPKRRVSVLASRFSRDGGKSVVGGHREIE